MRRHLKGSEQSVRGNAMRFTLIELLVVIAVIAILASLLMPALSSAKDAAVFAHCRGNLRQVTVGSLTYANDNNTYGPPSSAPEAQSFYTRTGAIDGYFHKWEGSPSDTTKQGANSFKNKILECPGTPENLKKGYKTESHQRSNPNNAISTSYYVMFRSSTTPTTINGWAGWYHIEGVPVNPGGLSTPTLVRLSDVGKERFALYHNDPSPGSPRLAFRYRSPSGQPSLGDPCSVNFLTAREEVSMTKFHKMKGSNTAFVDGHVTFTPFTAYLTALGNKSYWREFHNRNGGLGWAE